VDRFDFFAHLPRNEPGGTSFTSAYLSSVKIHPTDRVLDLRSAGGDRTVWIARSRLCKVIAVDEEPRYAALATKAAEEGGAGHLVSTVTAKYDDLPFDDESFDLILAESSANGLGLAQALSVWRRLVPKDGFIAVTYPGVVNKESPPEVRQPIEARMVEPMKTLKEYHEIIKEAGFELVHQTPLPNILWETFYTDAVRRAWALIDAKEATKETPVVRDVLAEARWYRRIGRGRVFIQAFMLRRGP
jgi:ubiquinone/menaquinone biosynthesis C-methylase UbiE